MPGAGMNFFFNIFFPELVADHAVTCGWHPRISGEGQPTCSLAKLGSNMGIQTFHHDCMFLGPGDPKNELFPKQSVPVGPLQLPT